MDNNLIEAIREHVVNVQRRSFHFAPASIEDIEDAERALGFKIPDPLKLLYLNVGNGGFGPGRGGNIVGVRGGYTTSAGSLVDLYADMQAGATYFGQKWQAGLLPFCEWGCSIFSCVDCHDSKMRVYLAESCRAKRTDNGLEEFLKKWTEGIDLLG